MLTQARREGVTPLKLGETRLGGIGAQPLAERGVGLREKGKKLKVFLAGEGSDLREDAAARRECNFVDDASRAELIVVDALSDIEIRQDAAWLRLFAIVVGFGKPVLSRKKWELPRPDWGKGWASRVRSNASIGTIEQSLFSAGLTADWGHICRLIPMQLA